MANNPTADAGASLDVTATPPTPAEQQAQAMAKVAAEAEELQLDTTVPGGRYLVNNVLVDSEGKPISKSAGDPVL